MNYSQTLLQDVRPVPVRRAVLTPAPTSRAATGFLPRSRVLHRAYNLGISLALLAVAMPLMLLISMMLFATQGRRIFYRGERIGEDGRIFRIFKFRTLDDAKARALTLCGVLPADSGAETPLGGFLRDTRLDELPQLLNVVLGDMNICGPRPVRPEIAQLHRRSIPGYDIRFRVKPGLIGHTQAYMNHGVSKAIRARYNGTLCRAPVRYRHEIGMVALVGWCVAMRTVEKLWGAIRRGSAAKADAERARRLAVRFVDESGRSFPALAVNRRTLTLGVAAPRRPLAGRITLTLPDGTRRSARVALEPAEAGAADGLRQFRYAPETEYGFHVLSRYLMTAVVVPHRSMVPGASIRDMVAGGRRGA